MKKIRLFFCWFLSSHGRPKSQTFDGYFFTGKCPYCGKELALDSKDNFVELK